MSDILSGGEGGGIVAGLVLVTNWALSKLNGKSGNGERYITRREYDSTIQFIRESLTRIEEKVDRRNGD